VGEDWVAETGVDAPGRSCLIMSSSVLWPTRLRVAMAGGRGPFRADLMQGIPSGGHAEGDGL